LLWGDPCASEDCLQWWGNPKEKNHWFLSNTPDRQKDLCLSPTSFQSTHIGKLRLSLLGGSKGGMGAYAGSIRQGKPTTAFDTQATTDPPCQTSMQRPRPSQYYQFLWLKWSEATITTEGEGSRLAQSPLQERREAARPSERSNSPGNGIKQSKAYLQSERKKKGQKRDRRREAEVPVWGWIFFDSEWNPGEEIH